jgi:hypothetical protein
MAIMTKVKAGIICVALIAAAAVWFLVEHKSELAAREENQALRAQIEQLAAENERLSNEVAKAAGPTANTSQQETELLRLRNEVGGLKRQLGEAARAQAEAKAAAVQQTRMNDAREQQKEQGIRNMTYTKGWVLAFWQYAQQHGGQLPSDFESAAEFAPEAVKGETNLTTQQFEIVHKGAINEITNPQSVILIREKQAWQTLDGGWVKGYGFADGHSEIHKAQDGNFTPWESQHIAPPLQTPQGQ